MILLSCYTCMSIDVCDIKYHQEYVQVLPIPFVETRYFYSSKLLYGLLTREDPDPGNSKDSETS